MTFKVILLEKGKEEFWKEICKSRFSFVNKVFFLSEKFFSGELGLICDEETTSSQVKKSEAEQFLKEDETKIETTIKPDVQESEENLLDELE